MTKAMKIVPTELSKEKRFYIENHVAAGIPLIVIANRLECNTADIERFMKRSESDANIQNIG